MPINVSGSGARGGVGATNQTNAQLNPMVPPDAAARAQVGAANARGPVNDSSLGQTGGQQFGNPGAAGVTKYGLFGGGGQQQGAPPMRAPPGFAPTPTTTPSQPGVAQPIQRQPPMQIPRGNPLQPGGVKVTQNPGGTAGGFSSPGAAPPSPRGALPHLPMNLGTIQQKIAAAPRLVGGQPGAQQMQRAPTRPMGNVAPAGTPSTTMQAQTAAPPAGSPGSVTGQNFGDSTDSSGVHAVNQDGTRADGGTGQQAPPAGASAGQGAGSADATAINSVVGDPAGAAAGLANGALTTAGGAAGQSLADLIAGYNQGMGGQANPSFSQFFNQMAPGFQENSLTNSVGQNMQQMMDPAAWEQSAQNQLANDTVTNTASLNAGERRLQDQAGRSGLANTGGADASLLRNYAGQQDADARNVFNDTLGHQMTAANMASSYANGLRGQDVSMQNMLTGQAGQGAGQDLANAREDNPSLVKVLQSLLSGAGAAAGAGASGLGSIASILPLLAA